MNDPGRTDLYWPLTLYFNLYSCHSLQLTASSTSKQETSLYINMFHINTSVYNQAGYTNLYGETIRNYLEHDTWWQKPVLFYKFLFFYFMVFKINLLDIYRSFVLKIYFSQRSYKLTQNYIFSCIMCIFQVNFCVLPSKCFFR